MADLVKLRNQLILHEGLRFEPYADTEGNLTIGVGYNVTARTWEGLDRIVGDIVEHRQPIRITRTEALQVLQVDIIRVEAAVRTRAPWYDKLVDVRQRVVLDMAFNLGFKAAGFVRTIAAIKRHDWSSAARGLYQSRWAHQVGDGEGGRWDRADRLAEMLLTGREPTDIPAI